MKHVPDKLKDQPFKELFSDKAVVAFLVTQLIPAYKGKNPPPLDLIERVDTELRIPGSGFVRADLLWHIPFPDLKHYFYFNIDGQNHAYPGYPVSKRIQYQGAVLLATQPRNGRNAEEYYANLEPIYELWIFPYPPVGYRLSWQEEAVRLRVRSFRTRTEAWKPVKGVLVRRMRVCLNGNEEIDWKGIEKESPFRAIGILVDPFLDEKETARLLKEDYGFVMDDYTKEAKTHMYDWKKDSIEYTREEGMAQGRAQGRAEGRGEGIADAIAQMRAQHIDETVIQTIETNLSRLN